MMVRVANLPQGRCLDFEVAFLGERRLTLIHSIWRLGSNLVVLFLLVVVLAIVKVLLVELEHSIHIVSSPTFVSYILSSEPSGDLFFPNSTSLYTPLMQHGPRSLGSTKK